MLVVFLKALGIGIAVAAPVGPMSVLCMRRTLSRGWPLGISTGLGIATADGIYALVAALGLVGVARFMLRYDRPLHFAAGAFLLYLALRTLVPRPKKTEQPERIARSPRIAYGSALLLTLTNPPTIISFAAVFTVLAPPTGFSPQAALLSVAGVFAGSSLWWLGLTAVIGLVRHTMGARVRRLIDIVSSAVLGVFGIVEVRRAL